MLTSILWALMATGVALMPMRHQYKPGLALLLAAPFLIVFIGYQHGWFFAVLGLAAFMSMFRNPLRYIYRLLRERVSGESSEAPE